MWGGVLYQKQYAWTDYPLQERGHTVGRGEPRMRAFVLLLAGILGGDHLKGCSSAVMGLLECQLH